MTIDSEAENKLSLSGSHWGKLLGFCLFVMVLLWALAVAGTGRAEIAAPPPPQIWSDKADYAPGETVTLSGANWASGESVHIRVNDDAGQTWSRDVDVTAADDGTISDQFQLPAWFVAQYTVTATGASSGTATWTFTDGNVSLHPAPAGDGVTQYRVTYDLWNSTSTTCGGAAHNSPAPSSTNLTLDVTSPNNTNIPGFGGNTSSALLKSVAVIVPATGKTFDKWTSGDNKTDSGTTVPSPACVTNDNGGGGGGNLTDLYAHFKNANAAPVCSAGSATTPEDTPVATPLNCTDADGNPLTYTITSGPSNGSLSGTAPNLTYSPNANFNGTDSFQFKANDGTVDSNVATFNLTITEVNDAPTTTADSKSMAEDGTLIFAASTLTTNDSPGPANESGQTLTVTAVSATASTHGSVSLSAGNVTYTPDPDFNGAASFTYTVQDNGTTNGASDPKSANGTVNVTVTEVNDAPTAGDDSASVPEDSATGVLVDVLANDTKGPANENGQTLRITNVSTPAHGSAVVESGQIRYTPSEADYNGSDSFTYQITDDGTTNGVADPKSNSGTVNITVTPVNDTPSVARDDASVTVNEGQTASNTGTYSDVDGDNVTISASVGTVTKTGVGSGAWSWSFNTSDGPSQSQTVTITANDGHGGTATTTFALAVNNVKPTVTNVTATNTYSGPLVFMTSMIRTFFTDPGADAPWAASLSFSDGGTDAGSGNSSPLTINHTFLTPGCKTVTARVTDKDGAVSDPFGPTSINVGTGEFLPPMTNTRVTNKLKNGQVLPVRLKLTDCNGVAVTNLAPAIVMKEGDYTTGTPDDTVAPITVDSVSSADTNGIMRSVDGSYIYNMRVNVAKLNTDYTLIIYPFGMSDTTQSIRHVIQATK